MEDMRRKVMVCPTQWTGLEITLYQEMLKYSSSRQGGWQGKRLSKGKQTMKQKQSLRREMMHSQASEVLQGDDSPRDPQRLGRV